MEGQRENQRDGDRESEGWWMDIEVEERRDRQKHREKTESWRDREAERWRAGETERRRAGDRETETEGWGDKETDRQRDRGT
jgi:hypothetical protein